MPRILVLFCFATCVFAGVRIPRALHFDIEPHVNDAWASKPALVATNYVSMYSKIYAAASPLNVPIVADVPMWLATSFVGGNTKSILERAITYLDEIVVMAYRDWASGTRTIGDGTDGDGQKGGIVGSMQPTLALAEQYGAKVTAGIETYCDIEPNWVSFCGRTSTYMESQVRLALPQLATSSAFSGTIAVDNAYSWSILTPTYVLDPKTNNRALWQWQGINILRYPDRLATLIATATSHAVKTIYFDVLTIFGNNWSATTQAQLINFLTICDANDIDVDFVLGDATWCTASKQDAAMDIVNQSLDFIRMIRSSGGVAGTPVQTSSGKPKATVAATPVPAASPTPAASPAGNGGCSQNCAAVYPGSICDGGYCECPNRWRWSSDSTRCIAPAGVTSAAAAAVKTSVAATPVRTSAAAAVKTSVAATPVRTSAAAAAAQICAEDCDSEYPNSVCVGGFCVCPTGWRWSSTRSRCVPLS